MCRGDDCALPSCGYVGWMTKGAVDFRLECLHDCEADSAER